jgi:hypothetical protein
MYSGRMSDKGGKNLSSRQSALSTFRVVVAARVVWPIVGAGEYVATQVNLGRAHLLDDRNSYGNQGAPMPNRPSPHYFAHAPLPSSRAAVLSGPRARDFTARPRERPLPKARLSSAPDEIWAHYNNYRSNGRVGSAIFHIAVLSLIRASGLFGHKVVQQVEQREHVTWIAHRRTRTPCPPPSRWSAEVQAEAIMIGCVPPRGDCPRSRCNRLRRRRS